MNLMTPAIAALMVRWALAVSFLSAVADRFGLWGAVGTGEVAWGNFVNFVSYTQLLLWYLPPMVVVGLAWLATVLEIVLAIFMILGVAVRSVAAVSGVLLFLFAISMSIATGIEGPLSYSVWTASAAAFLLATLPTIRLKPE